MIFITSVQLSRHYEAFSKNLTWTGYNGLGRWLLQQKRNMEIVSVLTKQVGNVRMEGSSDEKNRVDKVCNG